MRNLLQIGAILLSGFGSLVQASGVFNVPVTHTAYQHSQSLELRDTITVEYNKSFEWRYAYFVDVAVGTPSQKMRLLIDTGISDILLTNFATCNYPCDSGYFVASSSNSLSYLSGTFHGRLGNATQTGSWILDNFSIGSVNLNQIPMALKTSVTGASFYGILGMGVGINEETSDCNYGNLLDQLVSQNVIPRKVWSFYGNDRYSTEANMVFGGYDEARFLPPLNIIYQQPLFPQSPYLTVTIHDIAFGNSSGTTPISDSVLPFKAILDTSNLDMELPPTTYDALYKALGGFEDSNYGTRCDCGLGISSSGQPTGSINFRFDTGSGPTIFIDYTEFVRPDINPKTGAIYVDNSGMAICNLAITRGQAGQQSYRLGLPLMRSAYIVFDQEEYSIGIAQAKFNVTSSSYVPVSTALGSNPYKSQIPTSKSYCFTSTATYPLASSAYSYSNPSTISGSSSPAITPAPGLPMASTSSINHQITLPNSCSTLVSSLLACDVDVRFCSDIESFMSQNRQSGITSQLTFCTNPHSVTVSTRNGGVIVYNGYSISFTSPGQPPATSRGNGVARFTPAVRFGAVPQAGNVVHVLFISVVIAIVI